MKQRILQLSLDLSTEIHALIDQLPKDKTSEDTEKIKTLSLAVQSHIVKAQSREEQDLSDTLNNALSLLTEMKEKMLENVKLKRLKKMAINPLITKMSQLETEIKMFV